jgi:hypothetical protein
MVLTHRRGRVAQQKRATRAVQAHISHWNALLPLDEADVFLEKRSSQDILRNGLVAVFLRKLE